MKKGMLVISIFFIIGGVASPGLAEKNLSILDGLNVRVGVNHLISNPISLTASTDLSGDSGVFREERYEPDQSVGFSLGTEYLFHLPSQRMFEFGVGVDHHFSQTHKYHRENPYRFLTSLQDASYDFSTTAVYMTGKYHFPTTSALQSYLLARVGYAFNEIDDFTNKRVIPGETPAEDVTINMNGDVEEVRHSPYLGIGFGLTFKDHFFVEPVYTYARLKYRVYMPVGERYGSYHPNLNYTADERHDVDHHTIYINVGYNFGSHTVEKERGDSPQEEKERLISGLHLMIGANKAFSLNSDYRFDAYDWQVNDVQAYADQTWVDVPEDTLTFSIGAEYMYPLSQRIKVGAGVEYNAESTFTNSHSAFALGTVRQTVYKQDLSNIVLYAAGKYYFDSLSVVQPYILGRIGYSINDWSFVRVGQTMDGSQEITNGVYFGTGFGLKLTKHLSTEIIYSLTPIETTAYYHTSTGPGRTETNTRTHKKSTFQSLHVMLSFNL